MTMEQKLDALNGLLGGGEPYCALRMRKPGDWFLSVPRVEIKDGPILMGLVGNGCMPDEAINNCWSQVVSLPDDSYIVVNATGPHRHAYRWNGFRWADVQEGKS